MNAGVATLAEAFNRDGLAPNDAQLGQSPRVEWWQPTERRPRCRTASPRQ